MTHQELIAGLVEEYKKITKQYFKTAMDAIKEHYKEEFFNEIMEDDFKKQISFIEKIQQDAIVELLELMDNDELRYLLDLMTNPIYKKIQQKTMDAFPSMLEKGMAKADEFIEQLV